MKIVFAAAVFLLFLVASQAGDSQTFCVQNKCADMPASFEKTPLFTKFNGKAIANKHNQYTEWRFKGQEAPLKVEVGQSKARTAVLSKAAIRVVAKKGMLKSDPILSISKDQMIRDDICDEQFFLDKSPACKELVAFLNLNQTGEAFAFGALYHMHHPENSQLVGLLGSMSLEIASIPLLSFTHEEFLHLKLVPGYYEAQRIRTLLVDTSLSLTQKLQALTPDQSKAAFGSDKPPISQMVAALAYLEIFGFKVDKYRGHLIPFYNLINYEDNSLSNLNGKVARNHTKYSQTEKSLNWTIHEDFKMKQEITFPYEANPGNYFMLRGKLVEDHSNECVTISIFTDQEMQEWWDYKRYLIYGIGIEKNICVPLSENNNRLFERLKAYDKIQNGKEVAVSGMFVKAKGKSMDEQMEMVLERFEKVQGTWNDFMVRLEESAQEKRADVLDKVEALEDAIEARKEKGQDPDILSQAVKYYKYRVDLYNKATEIFNQKLETQKEL